MANKASVPCPTDAPMPRPLPFAPASSAKWVDARLNDARPAQSCASAGTAARVSSTSRTLELHFGGVSQNRVSVDRQRPPCFFELIQPSSHPILIGFGVGMQLLQLFLHEGDLV